MAACAVSNVCQPYLHRLSTHTHHLHAHPALLYAPRPGVCMQVVLAKDTPGWLSLNIEGLDAPLQLTRHEEEVLVNLKVCAG